MNTPALNPTLQRSLQGSLIFAAFLTTPVSASLLTVNDLGGTTVSGDGLCTLPEAINNAEANGDKTDGDCTAGSGADTIKFKVSGKILSDILPVINDHKGLIIDGIGRSITLGNGASARNGTGFFTLRRGSVLRLNNLTVNRASGDETGGAMYNDGGTVIINNCIFSENFARYSGAIKNFGKLTIANSLFTKNRASRSAGAIRNGNKLTIINSVFSNNGASSATHDSQGGGAIENTGDVTVVNSTFSSNSARLGGGGGIRSEGSLFNGISYGASLIVSNSTFTDNVAGSDMNQGGGGIYSGEYNQLTVINSTFSGNISALSYVGGGGGAIHHSGDSITVFNSTFSGNFSYAGFNPGFAGVGGILVKGKGTTQLANTILADNKGGDCANSNPFTTNSNNLIKDGSCNPAISGDPKLGLLTGNGGPTQTFALLTGSPALDAGDDAICQSALVKSRDQRRAIRPKGAHCDIGAFEAGFADLSVSIVDTPDPVAVNNRLTWTVKVTNSGIVTASSVILTEQLPIAGYRLITVKPSQGYCNVPSSSGSLRCNLGNISNSKTATVNLVLIPTQAGHLNTTAIVRSNRYDNHLPNNKASQSTRVLASVIE